MAFGSTELACEFLARCTGKKILVPGNHDKKHLKHSNFRSQWTQITATLVELKINNLSVVLCHYPLESWNQMFQGSIHCHGHCHSSRERGLFPSCHKNRLDVGVDYHNLTPISFETVLLELDVINQQFLNKSVETLF